MEIDDLVRTITANVLKQMQHSTTREYCMVLSRRNPLITERIQQLTGEDVGICYFGEEQQNQTIGRYILPSLSCNNMADLAAGRAQGLYVKEVLSLLLQGTEVEVLDFDYKKFSETAPGPLYRLYESYLDTLKSFGLVSFREIKPEFFRCWKELVTEQVINETEQKGASTLVVSRTSKITPLALETAKTLNITIQKSL
ncbi:MAG: ethanolamine utilization protein [Desulforhopalus sp.]|jgi:ethanolamine utilization protein